MTPITIYFDENNLFNPQKKCDNLMHSMQKILNVGNNVKSFQCAKTTFFFRHFMGKARKHDIQFLKIACTLNDVFYITVLKINFALQKQKQHYISIPVTLL